MPGQGHPAARPSAPDDPAQPTGPRPARPGRRGALGWLSAPPVGRRLHLAAGHRRADPRPGRPPRPAGRQRPRALRQGPPAGLDADLAACLAAAPSGRLRITVRPVGGPLQATVEVVPPAARPRPSARPAPGTVAGGIGAHKWRDRPAAGRRWPTAGRRAGRRRAPADHRRDRRAAGDRPGERVRGHRRRAADPARRRPPAAGHRPGRGPARSRAPRPIRVGQKPITLGQLASASEVFVTNAVAACRSHRRLPAPSTGPATRRCLPPPGPVARRLARRPEPSRPRPHVDPAARSPTRIAPPMHLTSRPPPHANLWPSRPEPNRGPLRATAPAIRPASPAAGRPDRQLRLVHLEPRAPAVHQRRRVEVVRNDEVTAAEIAGCGARRAC